MKLAIVRTLLLSSCICSALLVGNVHAAPPEGGSSTTKPAKTAVPPKPSPFAEALDSLKEGDAATGKAAAAQIHEALQANPKTVSALRAAVKKFTDMGFHQEVVDLTTAGILAAPQDTIQVEHLQSTRVTALLAQGKNEEALAAAKQLFNVSTLKSTSNSILQVCQCLNAAYPTDRTILKRYRQEQMDGSVSDGTKPKPESELTLGKVKIDGEVYAKAADAITGENYIALLSRGNLLLLAGRPNEAWEPLERAYSMASEKELPAASEGLARCMKAQDGTIGRANAWVLSLRPKKAPAGDPTTQPVTKKE
jgi:tetratricopeptide (TPR) repeat protein